MPLKEIYAARTMRLEILNVDGSVDQELMPELSEDIFIKMYSLMVQMRKFDEKALNLQKQGRMGTYGSLRGQEAAQAGLAVHIEKTDWLVPSFREHGLLMYRGIPMHLIYAYWKGYEQGNVYDREVRTLPTAVPVGSQLPHATGLGLAQKLKKEQAITFALSGDGATSEGDFHEALNMAAVFQSRTFFFIQNNQWAISVPLSKQTAARSLAQRAGAYGMPGMQVDGNDVLAVYVASKQAVEHVRSGKGPYLIEAETFRMEHHTTADDQSRYRDQKNVAEWKEKDPIKRFKLFLEQNNYWDSGKEEELMAKVEREVDSEVERLESMPAPEPQDIFDYMYEQRPWFLDEQRKSLLAEVQK